MAGAIGSYHEGGSTMKECIVPNPHIFRDGKCVICGYVYGYVYEETPKKVRK